MKDHVTSIGKLLRLVDGKFMRGDVEIKPEIGNPEQIALLQKIERERTQREKDANDGRLDVYIHVEDIKYKVVCEFTCICGNKIQARALIILTIGKNWNTLFMRMGQSSAINATGSMRLMIYMQS